MALSKALKMDRLQRQIRYDVSPLPLLWIGLPEGRLKRQQDFGRTLVISTTKCHALVLTEQGRELHVLDGGSGGRHDDVVGLVRGGKLARTINALAVNPVIRRSFVLLDFSSSN